MRKEKPEQQKPAPSSKKKYQAPRVVEYGDLRKIVMRLKGGVKGDGAGNPATKA